MNKYKKILAITLTTVCLLGVSIFKFVDKDKIENSKFTEYINKHNYEVTTAHASRNFHSDKNSLIEHSNIIFIGTVKNVSAPIETSLNGENSKDGFRRVDLISQIAVDKIIKGDIQNDSIEIHQPLGYIIGNTLMNETETKEYSENNQYLFFLQKFNNEYLPLTPKQGQIFIKNIEKDNSKQNKYTQIKKEEKICIDNSNFPMFNENMSIEEIEKLLK